VCEGGTDFYKGHPLLHAKAYDVWHKNLFEDKLKDMQLESPEPYRVWEYYNQKASLTEAYDIAINNKGVRPLPKPTIKLSKQELIQAQQVIIDVKEKQKNKSYSFSSHLEEVCLKITELFLILAVEVLNLKMLLI